MKVKLLSVQLMLGILLLPTIVLANYENPYSPPNYPGDVYIVVKHKKSMFGSPIKTKLNIGWGDWDEEVSHNPYKSIYHSNHCVVNTGFVVKLRHSKYDRIPLWTNSDGNITYIKQGGAPAEWYNKCFEKYTL